MLKVGLTGGIGSGKSTVADIFRLFRIPVYVADLRSIALLSESSGIRKQVITLLGEASYDKAGAPDRRYIASRVFQDKNLLKALNAILHPAVREDFIAWCKGYPAADYVIQEAAILFESGGGALMDFNILVWAPEAVRIQRVMARDHTDEEAVRARMQHQMDEEEKVKLADFVLINDSGHSLIRQVLDLHHTLLYQARTQVQTS